MEVCSVTAAEKDQRQCLVKKEVIWFIICFRSFYSNCLGLYHEKIQPIIGIQ